MTESTTPDIVLTSEQIAGLLPHRYPFALVDRVIAHEPGVSATAIKNVTMNEPQFQGHFTPGSGPVPTGSDRFQTYFNDGDFKKMYVFI